MDPAKYADIFLEESREHLTTINQQLLEWERNPDSVEPVGALFRATHNIKGMSATMGYTSVATLAHRVENLLDLLRRRQDAVQPDMLELLFRSSDAMEHAVRVAVSKGEGTLDVSGLVSELDGHAQDLELGDDRPVRDRPSVPNLTSPVLGGRGIRVILRTDAALKGARAMVILGRLRALGNVFGVQPAPAIMETDEFDGRLDLRIETQHADPVVETAIRECGDVERVEIGDPVAEKESGARQSRHVRVDLRRLDALMDLIGELVTARTRLVDLSVLRADPELEDLVVRLSHLSASLQSEIIQARMSPGWQVFDRFPRVVRDLSRRLGKRVRLEVEGKEIELDRAILDELGDPLVHLVRNAIDHGIETPAERQAAGKSPEGVISLSAARERSTIVIRVADDGRGIDMARVIDEARTHGLAGDVINMRGDELLDVIAKPGFSTAHEVSDVSGRGVGIDVVTNRLRALGGSVDVQSEPGKGTVFTLRLPPTLAIVPALLAEVGQETYALPLTHVEETVDLDVQAVTDMEGSETIVVRDRVVPLVRLRQLIHLPGKAPGRQPVIILQIGERRSGLVVDRVAGQQEIVVKAFDPPMGTVPIFAGATIVGDGRGILILDAGRLV